MRLQLLLATAAAATLFTGAAVAQTADETKSSIPPTNDPSTFTDDQCGKHKGPKPCGAQVREVPIAEDSVSSSPIVEEAPAAEATTTEMYVAPPASPEVGTTTLVTNGPVPDTPENRARLGGPDSNGGKRTAPIGN